MPSISVAEDVAANELQHCSSIDDDSLRLACYDKPSGRQASNPIPPVAPPEPTIEDIGSESLPRASKDKALAIEARVTSCKKNSLEKYLFYFDNGQVWKQVSDKRVYFKDCDFNVIISKDFFGYKMQQEGEERRIRISRIK
jgi:hypothetical protein